MDAGRGGARNDMPLFLIGYMCSGKTTLGRALAEATGRRFVDLDVYVEERVMMPVAEIFARHGEAFFRRLEREALETLAVAGDAPVVACGGGTPCQPGNMELMRRAGLTVLLECDRDRLLARLRQGRARRPLIASMSDSGLEEFMLHHKAARRHWYEQAQLRFDSSSLETASEVADSVNRFINTILNHEQ